MNGLHSHINRTALLLDRDTQNVVDRDYEVCTRFALDLQEIKL